MQDKTQVFPLSSSDYVRTRLTHSMEAATVAKSLGSRVGFFLEGLKLNGDVHPLEIGTIVSAATLAHDIGNPPFGHSGEDAIRHWFKTSPTATRIKRDFSDERKQSDFANYEGNAQGFRILTRLQMYKENGGMRLTAATLGAFTKYPVQSPKHPEGPRDYQGTSTKKMGFFQAEKALFETVAENTGLGRRETEPSCWFRHPLSFLVEASDDICYRTVDLEDSFQQKLVSYEEVKHLFSELLADDDKIKRAESEPTERDRVNVFRSLCIGRAIDLVTKAFEENHDRILSGDFDKELISVTDAAAAFKEIKTLQIDRVFNNDRVLRVEATGFKVLGGLLDYFGTAVWDRWENNPSLESRKLFDLLPSQFVGPKRAICEDPYERLLRIIDYVSGMSDSYALTLFRNLSGISLP
jgi:dGTPase